MVFQENKQYFRVSEVGELIGESSTSIYHHGRNHKENFPQPILINDVKHWDMEDVENMREYFQTRAWRKGSIPYIKGERTRLMNENKKLRKRVKELENQIRELSMKARERKGEV